MRNHRPARVIQEHRPDHTGPVLPGTAYLEKQPREIPRDYPGAALHDGASRQRAAIQEEEQSVWRAVDLRHGLPIEDIPNQVQRYTPPKHTD